MGPPVQDGEIRIRPLAEGDLEKAGGIIRLAFATFLNLPAEDPNRPSTTDYARTRWTADRASALAAEHEGELIGSNFATHWGSFGFFGPLTVTPAYWNRGVAQRLLAPTMDIFRRWGAGHLGLYTFAQSPKHIALYQKFGFWPRDLVAVMGKSVAESAGNEGFGAPRYSDADLAGRANLVAACREVSDSIYSGLDAQREIRAVAAQHLGDTILLASESRLEAFAVCHAGAGTEAGAGACYVKFAAVRPGPQAANVFSRLLDAAESYAAGAGARKITAGVNLARREAFQQMIAHGFRTEMQGVAMESGGPLSGYNRAGVYVLDDWR